MVIALNDKVTLKKLVVAGNGGVEYESVAGTMTLIAGSDTAGQLDTTDQLMLVEAYSKVFVINGAKLRVADFVNTKLTAGVAITNVPVKGTSLTQDTSGAKMIVDFIDSTKTVLYGRTISTASFNATDVVKITDTSTSVLTPSIVTEPSAMPHWYDYTVYPDATRDTDGSLIARSFGALPTRAYIGCLYRGRIVLAGDPDYPHQWYMSRQANPWDWAYAANDAQSPVAGNNADAGEVGDIIRALVPYKDDYMVIGCANSIWVCRGDPAAGGSLDEVDLTTGMFGPFSHCWDGSDNLYFWGSGGIYKIPPGLGPPQNLTATNMPSMIQDIAADPTTHRITMGYDRDRHGIMICITKVSDATNKCFWYDLRTEGFFPEEYHPYDGPFSLFYYDSNTVANKGLLMGCADGYIRTWGDAEKHDDINILAHPDEAIDSYVVLGPQKIAQDDDSQGRLQSFTAILASVATTDVDYYISVEDTAETVIENITGTSPPTLVLFSGTIATGGRVQKYRTRARGTYLGMRLACPTVSVTWGFEKIIGHVVPAGGN